MTEVVGGRARLRHCEHMLTRATALSFTVAALPDDPPVVQVSLRLAKSG